MIFYPPGRMHGHLGNDGVETGWANLDNKLLWVQTQSYASLMAGCWAGDLVSLSRCGSGQQELKRMSASKGTARLPPTSWPC